MGSRLIILSESAHGQVGEGLELTKDLTIFLIYLRGSNCFYGGGAEEDPYQYSYGNQEYLGFFQVGSGNFIPYYAGGVNLTKSMTTFFSHQDILQRGSNNFSRKG